MDSISTSKFLKLLWRMVTKPPFLQLSACVMLHFWPQGYIAGKPLRDLPYLKLRASLKSPLIRAKLNSAKGNTPSHEDTLGILTSCIAGKV